MSKKREFSKDSSSDKRQFNQKSGNGAINRTRYLGGSHCGKNDVTMHLKGNLITKASMINFALPQGITQEIVSEGYGAAIPSVCSIGVLPSFGKSTSKADGINKLTEQLMAKLRSEGHISQNYDQNDVMIYLQAYGEFVKFIAWVKRVVTYGYTVDRDNWYISEALAAADNVDWQSIKDNRAHLETDIKMWINDAGGLNVPSDLDFIELPTRYYNGIYEDDEGSRRQFYMFVPEMFMGFQLDSNSAGSVSKPYFVRCADSPLTYADIKAIGNGLWSNLYADETYTYAMSGDIKNTFGESGLYKIPTWVEGDLTPVFNEQSVICQIRNSIMIGKPDTANASAQYGLFQDPTDNILICNPRIKPWDSNIQGNALTRVNKWISAPKRCVHALPGVKADQAYVMEATRFMPMFNAATASSGFTIKQCGLINLTYMKVFWYTRVGMGNHTLQYWDICTLMPTSETALDRKLAVISAFSNHPTIVIYDSSSASGSDMSHYSVHESAIDQVGYISQDTLSDYHFSSVYSLYSCRLVGNIVG